jgi:4-aminobutyrate aminotransferase/(S)-3-amino-2-methylpropionate transaminase
MAAVAEQAQRVTHTCFQVMPYEPYVRLAERLNALAPGDEPKKTIFLSTGAEAVENAVKIARAATRRPGIIAFSGAFHGRTMMTMALTGKVVPYKVGFGPFPGEVYHVPFPIPYHGVSVEQSLAALHTVLKADIEPERVAAIIVEPVQGEGGFYIAPAELLREVKAVCAGHGILFISDEIQAGMARTGRWLAIEHSGVAPDLITVAKSLAGGFPLSAVIGRAEIMDAVAPGGLGGTYAGNPIACAAANAVLDVIEEEGLLRRALEMGERITGRLEAMQKRNDMPFIGEVRGLGAMVGMELVKDRIDKEPHPELTKALTTKAREKGLILLSCGTGANVIRILVPLTASDAIVDEGLDIIERSLEELAAA